MIVNSECDRRNYAAHEKPSGTHTSITHATVMRRVTFDLDIDSARDHTTSYRARAKYIRSDVRGIIATRSLGGALLLAASCGLRP